MTILLKGIGFTTNVIVSIKRKEDNTPLIGGSVDTEFFDTKTKEGNDVTYLGMNLKTRKDGSIELSYKISSTTDRTRIYIVMLNTFFFLAFCCVSDTITLARLSYA